MKKYTWLCAVICLVALLIAGCTGETADIDQQTQDTSVTQNTTEEHIDGIEDSIFDGATQGVEQPTGKTDESTPEEPTAEQGSDEQTTTEAATAPTVAEDETLSYEQWLKLSPTEQRLYQESFSDIEAFYVWYDAAKKAYEAANPPIEIGSGTIDMSTLPT